MKFYNKIPYPIRHILSVIFGILPEFKGRNFIVRRGRKVEDEFFLFHYKTYPLSSIHVLVQGIQVSSFYMLRLGYLFLPLLLMG